jgi:murein DD-endopeptidase MepM/ murein hydrolase activator NlpD
MTNVANVESKMANANLKLQANTYANSDKDARILKYEEEEQAKINQLKDLNELFKQVQNKMQELDNQKDSINTKLNNSEKTTDSEPKGSKKVSSISKKAVAEPLNTEFSASRSTKVTFASYNQPIDITDIDQQERTGVIQEEIMQEEISQDEITFEEDFNTQANNLYDKFSEIVSVMDAKSDTFELLDEKADEMIPYWDAYPSIFPVKNSYVTCPFGWRKNPFGRKTMEFHNGVDLKASYGTSVYATGKGKVIFSGWSSGYGKLIVIDHGYGISTQYAHNSTLLVSKGDRVKRGDKIAKSGNTGRSTGPHVHYGILLNGVNQNPLNFIYKKK